MPREITDDEWNYLQSRRQVADFVESIYNDPQLGPEAKRLIKKKYPNLQIPDYDIEEKVEKRLSAADKKRQDEEDKKRKDEEDARFKSERDRTKKDYGFTDEAMERLEKLMVERNIGDYEVAASYLASKEPKASEPDNWDNSRWDHGKKEGFAEIAKDPEGWGRTELLKAIKTDQAAARGGR
jgi:hypothetical protein